MTLLDRPIDFAVPDEGAAPLPAELRGSGRDDVRLMVANRSSGSIQHDWFPDLENHLRPGDVVVVNTSATLPAAVEAYTDGGQVVMIHLASPAPGGLWTVEIRTITEAGGTTPGPDLAPQGLDLAGGARVQLLARNPRSPRLWITAIEGIDDVPSYLATHGRPIRYLPGTSHPISAYQTIFAIEAGSAEMPSAGRPFTPQIVTRLAAKGVVVVPILLHAGVSSYEDHELPGAERFSVPASTAGTVNALREMGGRVVAVGTTVVRALETVADERGHVHAGEGFTDLIVTPERGVRTVAGILTGWHEPRSSHLKLLEAIAGRELLQRAYEEAVVGGYLWHEFGDELLILD